MKIEVRRRGTNKRSHGSDGNGRVRQSLGKVNIMHAVSYSTISLLF